MSVLAKGAACFRCHKRKEKCDARKPICSRCEDRNEQCVYPPKRAPMLEALEARVLELELSIHKLTMASEHDLSLVSARLLERIGRLGDVAVNPKHLAVETVWLPVYPISQYGEGKRLGGQIAVEKLLDRPTSDIQKALVENQLVSYEWAGLGELPLPTSLHLINMFLPYRVQFYFFIDASYFLRCLSLPSSHPDSIHPCLLNACYLAACASSGGTLAFLEPYFIQRTRHFLEQSLMFADRITHFLWASVILGCYFARERRLQECFVVAGSAIRFAFACGLCSQDNNAGKPNEPDDTRYLLAPPKDEAEAINRIQLANALYLMDQTAPLVGGCPPSFPYDPRWASNPTEGNLEYPYGKGSVVSEEHLSKLWNSDLHLKVSIARMFDRVTDFARDPSETSYQYLNDEYGALEVQISDQQSAIARSSDAPQPQSSGHANIAKPNMLLVNPFLLGIGLLMHSVRAGDDMEARRRMYQCLQALVEISQHVHMMNAIRVLARELQHSETRGNSKLSTTKCNYIESLLDFIEEVVVLFPAWAETPVLLKETLTTALNSLAT
ncbi:hypothetical protein DL93DRAFT_412130 [Clavulina sp. PMI_390]|nr:hypothetical protein DL93DRAFT_412130 [Clavulina sp. PMI_390]